MNASVIVLAWNGMPYLPACLEALLAQDYPDTEVILVDNASTDGSAEWVAAHCPSVRLIRNERNLGFAGGNNVGLRAAVGDVLVLLNQDTAVRPGWLRALVEALRNDRTIGIVGAKALYPDGVTLQHAGGCVTARGEGYHLGYRERDEGQRDRPWDVDYVTGASLAITRAALEAIGPLDEGFDLAYYEDIDWCYRARGAGYRVVYVPQAVLVHHEVSAAHTPDYAGMARFQGNRLRFVLKHWPLEQLEEFAAEERAWLEGLGEGAETLVAATQAAYFHHLLHLADVIAWRPAQERALATEALARVLLSLRTLAPLGPTGVLGVNEVEQQRTEFAEPPLPLPSLDPLRRLAAVEEHPFRSAVPLLGPLIAAVRRAWNWVSTEHYIRPILYQQREFNEGVVAALGQLVARLEALTAAQDAILIQHRARLKHLALGLNQGSHEVQRLGEVLGEYIAEAGRELAALACEVQRLREGLNPPADPPGERRCGS